MMIINPLSGKQNFDQHLKKTIEKFNNSGFNVDIKETLRPKQATDFARQACEENYERLIIVGGDGTFNECVNGLMDFQKKPIIGYVPAGTCCDIGMTLGLTKNVNKAVSIILNEQSVKMDVVKANDRYFCYVSGNGAFVDISYVTDSKLKKKIGYLAYIIKGLQELFTIPKMKMTISHDEGLIKGVFSLALVINSKRVAGINMIYKPKLDDGKVDVVLYRNVYPFNGMLYLLSFLFPFWSSPLVRRFKTKEIKIETSTTSKWNVDGESGGIGNQNFKVCRHAIEIIVPKKTKTKYFLHQENSTNLKSQIVH